MSKKVLSTLEFTGGAKATGLPAPTVGSDAVNLDYVNGVIAGLAWKDNVRAATTGNVNLSNPGTAVFDGVTLDPNDRLLVKDQTLPEENGIYAFATSTTPLTRTTDANTGAGLVNAVTSVDEGTANADTTWRQETPAPIVLGTTALSWTAFGTVTPDATETVKGKVEIATQAEVLAGTLDAPYAITPAKLAGTSHRADVGGATSVAITHNLGTRDVSVTLYRNSSPWDEVSADVEHTDANTVTFGFQTAPAAAEFRCVIQRY